jgi:hypothetical protein
MTTTTSPAALVPVAPVFTNTERLALAGFLAGYRGLTAKPMNWPGDLSRERCFRYSGSM